MSGRLRELIMMPSEADEGGFGMSGRLRELIMKLGFAHALRGGCRAKPTKEASA